MSNVVEFPNGNFSENQGGEYFPEDDPCDLFMPDPSREIKVRIIQEEPAPSAKVFGFICSFAVGVLFVLMCAHLLKSIIGA